MARFIRRLYDWTLSLGEHKHALPALCFITFIESVIFPLPVDPLLFAMGAAKPGRAIFYAFLTTSFSVLGGLVGYALGFWFWDITADFFLTHIFSKDLVDLVMGKFHDNAFLAIFLAGLTPIPYKVFTISAGVASLSLPTFIIASFFGRGLRYFLIGGLLYYYGPEMKAWLEKNLTLATIVLGVVIVVFFVVFKVMN